MKLWILRPIERHAIWDNWFDKVFGFVVRAETENQARTLAADGCGEEGRMAWIDSESSACGELFLAGEPCIIIKDCRGA